jgi:hypothetical protein
VYPFHPIPKFAFWQPMNRKESCSIRSISHVVPTSSLNLPCNPPLASSCAAAAHSVTQAAAAVTARPPAPLGLAAACVPSQRRGAGAQLGAGCIDSGERLQQRMRLCQPVYVLLAVLPVCRLLDCLALYMLTCLPAHLPYVPASLLSYTPVQPHFFCLPIRCASSALVSRSSCP